MRRLHLWNKSKFYLLSARTETFLLLTNETLKKRREAKLNKEQVDRECSCSRELVQNVSACRKQGQRPSSHAPGGSWGLLNWLCVADPWLLVTSSIICATDRLNILELKTSVVKEGVFPLGDQEAEWGNCCKSQLFQWLWISCLIWLPYIVILDLVSNPRSFQVIIRKCLPV